MLSRQPRRTHPFSVLPKRSASVAALLSVVACGPNARVPTRTEASNSGHSATLQERHVDERPEVAIIVRSGDPRAGLSLVLGAPVNVRDLFALSALYALRLEKAALPFEVRPSIDTIAIVGPLETAESTGKTVAVIDACVRTAVQPMELNSPRFGESFKRIADAYSVFERERERSACFDGSSDRTFDPRSSDSSDRSVTVQALESLRRGIFSYNNARWGIVGDERTVATVVEAIEHGPAWSSVSKPKERRAFDSRARISKNAQNHATLIVKFPSVNQAFELQRGLSKSPNEVLEILAARCPRLRLGSVRSTSMIDGGCLRIDWDANAPLETNLEDEFVEAAQVVIDSIRANDLATEVSQFAKVQAVLEVSEAPLAAQLAAEISLSKDSTQIASNYFDVQLTDAPKRSSEQLAVELLPPKFSANRIETVTQIESGQGRMYALLASPCIPTFEPKRLVGSAALFLSVAAERFSGFDGVTLEPWVSSEGAGLVASTGKLHWDESTQAQAERLGRALGRAASTLPVNNEAFFRARAETLVRLGSRPMPALWQAVQSLAPEHPGLVAPEGVYSTIEAISPEELRERQRYWQSGELRLAVSLSDTPAAADRIASVISRWRGVVSRSSGGCRLEAMEPATAGNVQLALESAKSGDAAVTVSIRLPAGDGTSAAYAQWLLRLMAASGGWLEGISVDAPGAMRLEATVVGGPKRRGLIIAIGGPTEKAESVAAAVSHLFRELGSGNVPGPLDYKSLDGWYRARELHRRSDPRKRLVELWTGPSTGVATPSEPSEAGFRTYLRRAFTEGEVTIVRATAKPEKTQDPPRGQSKATLGKGRAREKAAHGP